jgi:hypothetical protein
MKPDDQPDDQPDDHEPADLRTPVQRLMERIDAHEAEGAAIEEELARLKLTRRNINSIRTAQAQAARADETLKKLLGLGASS